MGKRMWRIEFHWSGEDNVYSPVSDSFPDSEWYSVFCDDSLSSESCSGICDMLLDQGSGTLAGVSCSFDYPWILFREDSGLEPVNSVGETILAQVHCLRFDWGYRQNLKVLNTRQPSWVRPSTSSHSRRGVRLSILMSPFLVSNSNAVVLYTVGDKTISILQGLGPYCLYLMK